MTAVTATAINNPTPEPAYPFGGRLNVERWNALRLSVEREGWTVRNGQPVSWDEVRELPCLSTPGPVFPVEQFKGGACSALTWLYALRAHCRNAPRVHLHGKTVDEQEVLLKKAIQKAPFLLGSLLDPVEG